VNEEFGTAVDQLLEVLRGSNGFRATRPELQPLVKELLA